MPALTRRRDPHRPDCWNICFSDVGVGAIGRCAGVPLHVDQWESSCGFYPLSSRGVSAGGTAASFEEAREAFGAAWARLHPKITEADYLENRRQRAWTAWKYAMNDASLNLPTQLASGQAQCFCGVEIDNKGLSDHVAAAHMEMQ